MRREREVLGRLYVAYHEANDRHFAGLLPSVPIYIETIARAGKVRTVAYLWTDDYTGRPRHLVFDARSVQEDGWVEIHMNLLHEMAHIWQAEQGRKVDHGPSFRAMCRRLGISERAVD